MKNNRAEAHKRIHMTLQTIPRTKKNHGQIITKKTSSGKTVPMMLPSKQYKEYERECGYFIRPKGIKIDSPVNVKCHFYMPTRRSCDLVNLLQAILDILVRYEVLEDDNYKIVQSMDGSRVFYDKDNPRVELWIDRIEEGENK